MAVYFGQEQGLGDLLGAGLGKGLNQLAQQKMQQMQTRKGLEGLLGPNMANQISQLPPDIAKQVIKQQLQNVQSQQRMNIFQQQYGGLQPGVNPGLEAITAGAQQPGQQQPGQQQPGESATGLQSLQPGAQQPGAQQPGPANVGGYVPGKQSSLALALGVDPGKAMELEEKASSEQRKERAELRKERLVDTTNIRLEKKDTLDHNKSITADTPQLRESIDASNKQIHLQNIMTSIAKEGRAATGFEMKLLKAAGLEKAITSPDTQSLFKVGEQLKSSALRNLPPESKRNKAAIDVAFDTVASSENTAEGIVQISKLNTAAANIEKIYSEAMLDEYSKEKYLDGKKKIPNNIGTQVWNEIQPKIKKYLDVPYKVTSKYAFKDLNNSDDPHLDPKNNKVGTTIKLKNLKIEAIVKKGKNGVNKWSFLNRLD